MIQIQKPSLFACVFGAGAVHALLLAAILPVLITLPAPDEGARRTVPVPVAVRTALPAPLASAAASNPGTFSEVLLYGEGDVDEVVLPAAVPLALVHPDLPTKRDLTEKQPLIELAALSDAVKAVVPVLVVAPVARPDALSDADVELSVVARLPDFMPDAVPRPPRKPAFSSIRRAPAAAKKRSPSAKKKARRKPVPSSRVTTARPKAPPKPSFGGFLGGRGASSMKEFPLPASR